MKKIFEISYLIIAILITLVLLTGIYEIINLKLLGNTGQYPFGSEKAIAEGGEHYKNEESYVKEMVREVIILAPVIVLIWAGQINNNNSIRIIALLLIIAIMIGNRIF
jgi:hypothetical protein